MRHGSHFRGYLEISGVFRGLTPPFRLKPSVASVQKIARHYATTHIDENCFTACSLRHSSTAVPAEGYRFVRWQCICARSVTDICETKVAQLLEEFADQWQNIDIGLWAKFEHQSFVRTWHRDADGDLFGTAEDTLTSAERPLGYVVKNRDCDDSNPAIYPWRDDLDWAIDTVPLIDPIRKPAQATGT